VALATSATVIGFLDNPAQPGGCRPSRNRGDRIEKKNDTAGESDPWIMRLHVEHKNCARRSTGFAGTLQRSLSYLGVFSIASNAAEA
jgi:hypothetical protein